MNRLTHNEYWDIRNEAVTLVVFGGEKRVLSHGNLNYKTAVEEALRHNELGREVMFFPDGFEVDGKKQLFCEWKKSEIKALYNKETETESDDSIRLNEQTVGNLKKYLSRFPDDAKVVITDSKDYKNYDCVICCNTDHQQDKNVVQLSQGFREEVSE